MADFTIKQNDTRPTLQVYLTEGPESAPTAVNLTGVLGVKLLMRSRPNPPGSTLVSRSGVVTSAVGGVVTFTFLAADTATVADFDAEVEVTGSDGGVTTYPNDEYLAISVVDDLG